MSGDVYYSNLTPPDGGATLRGVEPSDISGGITNNTGSEEATLQFAYLRVV